MTIRLTITEIMDKVEYTSGVCEPYICKCDDGNVYYVKGKNAGYKDCIHELVAASLGHMLNVNIPDFALVTLPDGFDAHDGEVRRMIGDKTPAFGLRKVENAMQFHCPAGGRELGTQEEREDILFFDWWIRNNDRTRDNPNLLVGADERIHVIDHNQAFDNTDDLRTFISSHVFGGSWGVFGFDRSRREPELDRIMSSEWGRIAGDIPDQWLDAQSDADGILKQMKSILTRYKNEPKAFWTGEKP